MSTQEKLFHFDDKLLHLIEQNTETGNIEACSIIERYNLSKYVNISCETLLHFAAKYMNVEVIKYLIESGSDVDVQNRKGQTPIILALEDKHYFTEAALEESIKLLCEANANIYITDNYNKSAAKLVIGDEKFVDNQIVLIFLEIIQRECMNNSELIAEKLLSLNCSLWRAELLENAEVLEHMIKRGCQVNSRQPEVGFTALHAAVGSMDVKSVELLIRYGADVNLKNIFGRMPLAEYYVRYVTDTQQPEIVKMLIDKMDSLTDADYSGSLAIHKLFQCGTRIVIRTVLEANCNILCVRDEGGSTPLHYLMANGHPGIMEELQNWKFDVNARDSRGCTPLFYAGSSMYSRIDKFQFLLDHGADVNARNNNQETLLFYLCRNWLMSKNIYFKIIRILLERDLDVQIVDRTQKTIFDVIINNKSFYMSKPLLAHLAIIDEQGQLITEQIRSKIMMHGMLKNYFDFCKRKLEKMKRNIITDSLTFYKVLIEQKKQIVKRFIHHKKILSSLKNMKQKCCSNYHYYGIIRQRIISIAYNIEMLQKASSILCEVFDLKIDSSHLVITEIIEHLDVQDIQILSNV